MNKVTVIELNNELTAQLNALKNNESIDEIKVIEISAENADDMAKVCIKLRDERFFIAYQNDQTKPTSVLWSNLNFVRKYFGLEKYNGKNSETSPVTFESLNYGRRQEIMDYKKAIELNVHIMELSNLQPDGSFGTYEGKDEFGHKVTLQRTPNKLIKSMKKAYERDIAKGLYVVCKYVGEVDLGFSI